MKNQSFLIIIFILVLALFYFHHPKKVLAGTNDNVWGWAWSGNIGWIKFNNCTDPSNPATCGNINYGVNISTDGNLTGYAWSENIGWIWFDPPGPYPSSPNYSARVDLTSGEISGWAKAIAGGTSGSGGWDGWIKLRGTIQGGGSYGVSIATTTGPIREFRGWAWGGDDNASEAVIGWISFNCAERGNCATSNYKVMTSFNQLPTARNLSVDPPNSNDYCGITGYPPVRLRWEFYDPSGLTQSAYQIQIDDNPDFSPPIIVDTGKVISSASSFVVAPPYQTLSWGRTYYWRIKVWNSQNVSSDWIVYQNNTPPPESFTTISQPFPFVNVNWNPQNPAVNQTVQFCSVPESGKCETQPSGGWTQCYVSPCTWYWTFPSDWEYATGSSSSSKNPAGQFTLAGDKTFNLEVRDNRGYSCRACPLGCTLNVRRLPIWFPIPPR